MVRQPFKHRQLFAATGTWQGGVDALIHMQRSVNTYADPNGFNAGAGSLHVACVFFEGDTPLVALDDAMYAKYPILVVAMKKMHPETTLYAERAKAAHANPSGSDYRRLAQEHGASFFVCNTALSGLSYEIAREITPAGETVSRDHVVAIHQELAAHVLPGTLLVPTGVAAMNAVQEEGFTVLPG
ncbi:MAG TPA: hypothetical protein VGN14_04255 [Candidatus Elarobacter sp.]